MFLRNVDELLFDYTSSRSTLIVHKQNAYRKKYGSPKLQLICTGLQGATSEKLERNVVSEMRRFLFGEVGTRAGTGTSLVAACPTVAVSSGRFAVGNEAVMGCSRSYVLDNTN